MTKRFWNSHISKKYQWRCAMVLDMQVWSIACSATREPIEWEHSGKKTWKKICRQASLPTLYFLIGCWFCLLLCPRPFLHLGQGNYSVLEGVGVNLGNYLGWGKEYFHTYSSLGVLTRLWYAFWWIIHCLWVPVSPSQK